jgi:hypothetical protein
MAMILDMLRVEEAGNIGHMYCGLKSGGMDATTGVLGLYLCPVPFATSWVSIPWRLGR